MEQKPLKREQQEVLSLLKEIDKICRKNKIPYFLSPQLTLCGVTKQPFPQSPLCGVVLMKTEDMERFRLAAEDDCPDRRAVESMKNNKHFPGFYLRYVNKDTLCYCLDEGNNFLYPGIGIDIIPLRGKIPSRKKHIWNRVLEIGWQKSCYYYNEKPGAVTMLCKLPIKLMSLEGRGRLGRNLYKKFLKGQAAGNCEEYVVRMDRRNTFYYPAEIFKKTSVMELEGEKFLVPDGKIWYLQKTYGWNYEEIPAEDVKPDWSVLVSALVGYEDYMADVGSIKKLIRARRRLYLWDSIGRRRQRYYKWCWNYAKLCADHRELDKFYEGKVDYIKNLYKSGDLMRLEAIFRPYTRMMQRCLKEDEIYVSDEEVMKIYLDVLEKTGNLDLKKQIEKYWN